MKISKLKLSFLVIILLVFTMLALVSCDELLLYQEKNNGYNQSESPPENGTDGCRHSWRTTEIVSLPTCGTQELGVKLQTCAYCGEVREKEIYPYTTHVIERTEQKATCGIGGFIMEKCKNCGYFSETPTSALTHNYQLDKIPGEDGACGIVCTHCGDLIKRVSIVHYEDFGAVGDGKTDDSEAIRAAHEAANRCGLPVEGKAGAAYYIGAINKTITIKTNTNWNGAKLIFDDNQIPWNDSKLRNVNVFTIEPDKASYTVDIPEGLKISKGQTNVGMTFSESCILKIENSNEKIYLRYGENANGGVNKNEMIIVDANGNVDPSTPIQYDYVSVTKITVYSLDETPISVGNATIQTIAPNPKSYDPSYENNYCYYARGLLVKRSNTTVHNITHIVDGEDLTIEIDRNGDGVIDKWGADKSYGVPYAGFFNFQMCNNAVMTDCLVEGHQAYCFWQDLNGQKVRNEMGSYDIGATDCIGLKFIRITQYENQATGEVITNRFMYHGVMGSNFCRNVEMDGCYLDRFDSHQGLHNARITNSTLGFGILVIGGGELYIENVTRISGGQFVHLRGDYNSVFDGNLIIKNCKAEKDITSIVYGNWRSFYNGLPNYFFRSVTIDGFEAEADVIYIYNVPGANKSAVYDTVNKLYLPDFIKVSGVNATVKVSTNSNDAFADLALTKF